MRSMNQSIPSLRIVAGTRRCRSKFNKRVAPGSSEIDARNATQILLTDTNEVELAARAGTRTDSSSLPGIFEGTPLVRHAITAHKRIDDILLGQSAVEVKPNFRVCRRRSFFPSADQIHLHSLLPSMATDLLLFAGRASYRVLASLHNPKALLAVTVSRYLRKSALVALRSNNPVRRFAVEPSGLAIEPEFSRSVAGNAVSLASGSSDHQRRLNPDPVVGSVQQTEHRYPSR